MGTFVMDTELTEQQRRFIAEYLIDLNATQAYRRAYPECHSYASAKAAASRLLKNINIRAEIRAAQSGYLRRRKVSADKVLQKLGTIAFAEIVDIEGKTKLRDIPVISRRAIKTIKYKDGNLVECKYHDALRALELLFRHLGCSKELPPLEADDCERRLRRNVDSVSKSDSPSRAVCRFDSESDVALSGRH